MTVAEREHFFSWEDPNGVVAKTMQMSGLEAMQAIASGDLPRPPVAALMDFSIPEVELGRAVFATTTAEWMMNPIGSVHGGMIATLLDSCVGCAVHTMLEPGVAYTTVGLNLNYVRGLGPGVDVRAEGNVVHLGSKTATAEGRLIETDSGKLIAHATTTCLILRS